MLLHEAREPRSTSLRPCRGVIFGYCIDAQESFFQSVQGDNPVDHRMSRTGPSLVDQLFALDNRIRYVAILDRNQRLKESRMRSNVPSLTPEAYDRKFMSSVPPLVLDALQQLEAQCGQLEQISIQYQRVDMVFFSFDNQIVVLSLEPGPMEPIWRKLRDTLGLPVRG